MARHRRSAGEATRARIIAAFERAPELPPTYQELADALGMRINTIKYHVDFLVEAGILTRTPRIARGIRLAQAYLPLSTAQETDPTDAAIIDFIRRRMTSTPFCPTTAEIAVALNRSQSTIRRHLKTLTKAGRIRRDEVLREAVRREYCLVERPSEGMVE